MSLLIVGTVAFDGIETPFGKVEKILGGSATYIGISASYFNKQSNLISVVGGDFLETDINLLKSHGIDCAGLEIIPEEKTFFWSGKYHDNMNKRDTIETQVNVLANFNPKIPKNYTNLDILVLGNLDPKVQLSVISQFEKRPKFTMLDTMNFWMDNTLDDLLKIISKVDLICINDEEVIQLSGCKDYKNGIKKILTMGPKYLIMKKGEYGSTLYSDNLEFFCPSFKVKKVIDPTGAGDSFAGAFAGYLAESKNYTFESISSALIYANAVASFCVEKFGIENMLNISKDEIDKRVSFIKKHNN